jgi:hypothetical protein
VEAAAVPQVAPREKPDTRFRRSSTMFLKGPGSSSPGQPLLVVGIYGVVLLYCVASVLWRPGRFVKSS